MKIQASDWLYEARLARELQIHPQNQGYLRLPALIDSAVDYVSRYASLPLLGREVERLASWTNEANPCPLTYGDILFVKGVSRVEYWPEEELPPLRLERTVDGEVVPDIGHVDIVGPGRAKTITIYPRAAGWPASVRRRVFLTSQLLPSEAKGISDILVQVCRALFEGQELAAKESLWTRLLRAYSANVGIPAAP